MEEDVKLVLHIVPNAPFPPQYASNANLAISRQLTVAKRNLFCRNDQFRNINCCHV